MQFASRMPLHVSIAFSMLVLVGCGNAQTPATSASSAGGPTKEIVEKVLKASYEHAASSTDAKSTLTLNSVKFGPAYQATAQEVQVEGFPEGGMVTPAIVDFTVRTYYDRETQALQRVREARVYLDKMGEWAIMTGSPKGGDVRTTEPAAAK